MNSTGARAPSGLPVHEPSNSPLEPNAASAGVDATSPVAGDPDHRAIARVLAGDANAYGEIVARHEVPLRRVVLGILADRHLVEDVLQESFLLAYRKLPSFRGDAPFGAWLYRITVREALRARSRWRKLWRAVAPLEAEQVEAPPQRVGSEELEQELVELGQIPPRARAALVLHAVEERSYEEIADILGCPSGTVGALIHRARAKLKELRGRQS